ncbi:MAG: hypothetical protein AMJ46_13460 [Latescibacteria bacterium DG_63]|nr:MAG: hypothetical protein AMJ46_13460 [Latescibacteria bacterium DG_63]
MESALRIGETTLVPVVEIRSTWSAGRYGICFSFRKQPTALLMVSPIGKKAFSMSGEEMSFSEFLSQFPGIEQALHALESGWAQSA